MLRAVLGLRTNTAVFLALLLGPAALLAWLGFAATVPLEQELRRNALAAAGRAAAAAAATLPVRIDALLAAEQKELAAAAERLADELPTAGVAAFAAAEATLDRALVLRRASGDVLWPAPVQDLALAFLDEWPHYRSFERMLFDPEQGAAAHQQAAAFAAPSLRARALAALPDLDPEAVATGVADFADAELAAAGPRVVERLLASAEGRRRLLASPSLLLAVPATEAVRATWFANLGDRGAANRQQLRADQERDVARTVRAPLPGGAMLLALVDAGHLCARLTTTLESCTVTCRATAPGEAADASLADVAIELPAATALGDLVVRAEPRELPSLLADARRRQWLTGLGVLSLVGVMGLGVMLVRRAFRQEAAARELRDQFLANVSHDLKTPLTSLRLHAEMLTDPALDPATRARYAAVVQAEGARMSALVEDLLDVSALQQGRRRIEPEPVDLAAAVHAHAASWRPLLERDHVELRVASAPPAEALVDPIALGRILTNLLQNAVRHGRPARDGGPSWIELRAGPGPVLAVRDNGPGVPEELRERIFARFERAAATGEGLGLGLSLSRELAEACGGTLYCRDDGSTWFGLTLPEVPDEDMP